MKPILTVCANAAEESRASAATAAIFFNMWVLLLRVGRILPEEPGAPEGRGKQHSISIFLPAHAHAGGLALLGKRLRIAATECVSRERRSRRCVAEQLLQDVT